MLVAICGNNDYSLGSSEDVNRYCSQLNLAVDDAEKATNNKYSAILTYFHSRISQSSQDYGTKLNPKISINGALSGDYVRLTSTLNLSSPLPYDFSQLNYNIIGDENEIIINYNSSFVQPYKQ
jgi:hypothetical protein